MVQNIKKIWKRYGNLVIRSGVSLVLLYWMAATIDWAQFWDALGQSRPFFILAAFFVIQLTILASAWKWLLLVKAVQGRHSETNESAGMYEEGISFFRLLKLYYLGLFFNNFLPGSIGGDVARVYYLGRSTGVAGAAVSVTLERFTSGLALVGVALTGAFYIKDVRPYFVSLFWLTAFFVFIGLLIYIFLSYHHKRKRGRGNRRNASRFASAVNRIVSRLAEASLKYKGQGWKWWLKIAFYSVLFQVGMGLINDFLFRSFGYRLPWIEVLVIICLISALTMLPLSINGLGVREVSYIFFFQQMGVPEEIAVSVSLLFFLLVLISSLAGGVFFLSEKKKG